MNKISNKAFVKKAYTLSNNKNNNNFFCTILKSPTKKLMNFIKSVSALVEEKFCKTDVQGNICNLCGKNKGYFQIRAITKPLIEKTDNECIPFVSKNNIPFTVKYVNEQGYEKFYNFSVPKGYKWDGASIPAVLHWLIGKKNQPEFAMASMVHDIICENHNILDNNRLLGSGIFKELLKANGVSSFKANMMSLVVDVYQACCCKWGCPCR